VAREIAKANEDRTFENPGRFHAGVIGEVLHAFASGKVNEYQKDRELSRQISSRSPALVTRLALAETTPYDV
jgi:hypothetical protein